MECANKCIQSINYSIIFSPSHILTIVVMSLSNSPLHSFPISLFMQLVLVETLCRCISKSLRWLIARHRVESLINVFSCFDQLTTFPNGLPIRCLTWCYIKGWKCEGHVTLPISNESIDFEIIWKLVSNIISCSYISHSVGFLCSWNICPIVYNYTEGTNHNCNLQNILFFKYIEPRECTIL